MNPEKRKYAWGLAFTLVALVGSMAVTGAAMHRAHSFRDPYGHSADGDEFGEQQRRGFGPGMMQRNGNGQRGPGMMGMMGNDGSDSTDAAISLTAAKALAQKWLDANLPDATLDDGATMPMGYVFRAAKVGQVVAQIMVNDDTGQLMVREFNAEIGRAHV